MPTNNLFYLFLPDELPPPRGRESYNYPTMLLSSSLPITSIRQNQVCPIFLGLSIRIGSLSRFHLCSLSSSSCSPLPTPPLNLPCIFSTPMPSTSRITPTKTVKSSSALTSRSYCSNRPSAMFGSQWMNSSVRPSLCSSFPVIVLGQRWLKRRGLSSLASWCDVGTNSGQLKSSKRNGCVGKLDSLLVVSDNTYSNCRFDPSPVFSFSLFFHENTLINASSYPFSLKRRCFPHPHDTMPDKQNRQTL